MIIAHRGAHNNKDVPENSLLAFKQAIDRGYGIELDVRLTKDDKLVILHDSNLERMANIDAKIKDLTLDEIKKLRLLKTNKTIPTLREVLELVNGKTLLDIEIKGTIKVKKICDLVLKELKNYEGEIVLKSFSPLIVRMLKKKCNYKVGILITKNFIGRTSIHTARTDFIAIDKRILTPKYYNKFINKCPIYVWTFDDLKEVEKYIKKYPKIIPICNGLDTAK